MDYDIKPIERYYKGQHFKSILEARWAAFFDICEWKWAYEPYKIGNKIPDFVLKGISREYIVEVKPEIYINDEFTLKLRQSYNGKIFTLIVLNDKPFLSGNNFLFFGYEYVIPENGYYELFMKCHDDFAAELLNWDGYIKGLVNRKSFIHPESNEGHLVKHNWEKAGIVTKFTSY